jgi:hypothetical protein
MTTQSEAETFTLELDADEAWVSVHEDDRLLPIEGIEPRQHRVRLAVNGFGMVNANRVAFAYRGKKATVGYAMYRRGSQQISGALVEPVHIQKGDAVTFERGDLHIGVNG